MEEHEIVDCVLAAASVPDTTRQWLARRSLEAVGAFEQLEAIAQLFARITDALADLGQYPDSRAHQLAQKVKAEMTHSALSDFNERARADTVASGKGYKSS